MSENTNAEGGLGGLVDKAKGLLSDDVIDTVAEKVKAITPDSIDAKVDMVADKAKGLNDQ